MKVDVNRAHPQVTAQPHHNNSQKIQQQKNQGPNKQIEKSALDAESASKQNRARGAMRLLQEGHFKGVAALRLRINFFDQLSDLEQESIQATAQESVDELNLAIKEHIDGLNSKGLVEEETMPQLAELTDSFANELQNNITVEELDPQQLISSLQQNYYNFRTRLQNLLLTPEATSPQKAQVAETNPTEENSAAVEQSDENPSPSISVQEMEQPSEETITSPADTLEESETQAQLFAGLDALDSIFRSQLSNLEERLQDTTLLSVPEQPDNEGAAFQKFLSIYQDMQNSAATAKEPGDTNGS